LDVISQLFIG